MTCTTWTRTTTARLPMRASRALVLVAAGILAAAVARADETDAARAVVDQTVTEVLAVLNEPGLSTDQRRDRIEAIALDRFDFDTMSRLVLARNWRRFSTDQQGQFVEQFREYLSAAYGDRIERYDQEKVDLAGARLEPRGDVTVTTRIVGGEADGVQVDYRLRQRDDAWRVIDVVIEGISLVSSYRDQFTEVLGKGGPEELLRRLREKNVPTPEIPAPRT
jgi:phospholipid transport system substrate-binding protein